MPAREGEATLVPPTIKPSAVSVGIVNIDAGVGISVKGHVGSLSRGLAKERILKGSPRSHSICHTWRVLPEFILADTAPRAVTVRIKGPAALVYEVPTGIAIDGGAASGYYPRRGTGILSAPSVIPCRGEIGSYFPVVAIEDIIRGADFAREILRRPNCWRRRRPLCD